MSEIILRNVCKEFEKGSFAVKDFNLDIRDREFIIFAQTVRLREIHDA